jgi:hypothetical protein
VSRTRTIRLENGDHLRILASPVARAFVRTVMARRGISEAEACKVYLDYLNRSKPVGRPAASERLHDVT